MRGPSLRWLDFGNRLPVFLQSEDAECGLASIAMIASYHGHQTDLSTLRRRFSVSQKGATLESLIRIARALELESRPLRLEMEHLPQLALPCVIHWGMNHFVVLASLSRRAAVIHDPAFGIRTIDRNELALHFTGVALELRPTASFKPKVEAQRVSIRGLLGQVIGLRRGMIQVLLLGLVLEIFAVLTPFQLQWIVDRALLAADQSLLTTIGVGFLGLVLFQGMIEAARSWFVAALSTSMNYQWLGNVFSHLVRLPMSYFEKRHVGHIISCFNSVGTIQRTVTTNFVETALDGLLAVSTLVMMVIYSPLLAGISLIPVTGYALLRAGLFGAERSAAARVVVHEAKQQTHFMETAGGMQSVKLFDRSEERRMGWLNMLAEQFEAQLAASRLTIANQTTHKLLFGIERVAVIWMAAELVLQQRFTVGMLFAYLAYKEQFATRVAALVDKLFELRMLGLHAERVADIVYTEREEDHAADFEGELSPSIELRGVCVRYASTEPEVLHDINLRIEPGECVAIVGPSGGGKTTLMKVMLGLLDPVAGEVLTGGVPIRRLGLANHRRLIGTVMQDDRLFSGSLADNICFFDPTPDVVRIVECARLAAIHADILRMPMGYETIVGNFGTGLSGGQIQRILLARALYKRPRILVLDEATSHLDLLNERAVNEAVRAMQLTRVIVAHRPETIAMAQRVVAIENGRLVRDFDAGRGGGAFIESSRAL